MVRLMQFYSSRRTFRNRSIPPLAASSRRNRTSDSGSLGPAEKTRKDYCRWAVPDLGLLNASGVFFLPANNSFGWTRAMYATFSGTGALMAGASRSGDRLIEQESGRWLR